MSCAHSDALQPTIITALYPRESVIARQLKTVPPYVVGAVFNVGLPYLAYKTKRRSLAMALAAPLTILGFALFIGAKSNNVKYAAAFLVTSGSVGFFARLLPGSAFLTFLHPHQFPFGPLCTGAASANAAPDAARAASIGKSRSRRSSRRLHFSPKLTTYNSPGTVVMIGNIGGLISTWSYTPNYAPRYIPGNAINLTGGILIFLLTFAMLVGLRSPSYDCS